MIDTIFKDAEECIWQLNHILIYDGNTKGKAQAIVGKAVQQCVKYGLVVNSLKREFQVKETIFLEHVINGQEVKMDPSKLETMSKWPIPRQYKEIQV